MMFPIWAMAERQYPATANDTLTRIGFRCSIVLLSAFIAYSMPDFGKFLSLVGSSICTLLGFVLPCYFHWAVMGDELATWQRYLDVVLIVGGATFGVLGTFHSVRAMLSDGAEFDGGT
jgi:proton-coupled amino acid transporter